MQAQQISIGTSKTKSLQLTHCTSQLLNEYQIKSMSYFCYLFLYYYHIALSNIALSNRAPTTIILFPWAPHN